jgi:phosphohistidine phosphatase SixA
MGLLLVRHAAAGKRSEWNGNDRLRPLDKRGRRQARGLVDVLAPWRIERVLTSPYARCVQTIEPLAARLRLAIEEREELAEGVDRTTALALVDEVDGTLAVLCTHGDVVLELVGEGLAKGATAVLERDGELRRALLVPPPV